MKVKHKKIDQIKRELKLRIDFFSLFFVLEHIFFTGKAKVLTLTHATHTLMRNLYSYSLSHNFHLLAGEYRGAYLPANGEFLLSISCMFRPGIEGSDHDPGVALSPTIHAIENHSEFIRGAVPTGDCESFRDTNLQKMVL